MKSKIKFLFVLLSFMWLSDHVGYSEEPLVTTREIKSTVQRALPYVKERGEWWIDKKNCASCHRVTFTVWSHVAALKAGFKIERDVINHWISWCHDDLLKLVAEKDKKHPGEKQIERNFSGAAQWLAASKNWDLSEQQQLKRLEIIEKLCQGQEKDGSWKPKGQLPAQKREVAETTHVVTLFNSIILSEFSQRKDVDKASIERVVQSAQRFVDGFGEGKTSEWIALRAWFASKRGNQNHRDQFLKRLLKSQNKDGGWGWVEGEESDVLASAQVLFVLLKVGENSDSNPVRRVATYLVANQQEDGSWKVKGTKKKAKEKFVETANYWGSAWAVIALTNLLSLDNAN